VLRWFARYPRILPIGIFFIVALLTVLAGRMIELAESEKRRADIEQFGAELGAGLERRANANAACLRSGAALFATQERVPTPLLQTFISQLRLDANFRNAEGIGWAERIDTQDIAAFEAQMRRCADRALPTSGCVQAPRPPRPMRFPSSICSR